MGFNSVESIADSLCECCCTGSRPFEALDVYRALTPADLDAAVRELFAPSRACLSVVRPLG